MKEGRHETFPHDADVGVRGIGTTLEEAFGMAARALTAVVTDVESVRGTTPISVSCSAPDDELLLVDWLNAVIYEMSRRKMLFARFEVRIDGTTLHGVLHGEPIDRERHRPAVEPKGATYTELAVGRQAEGLWYAQCVVDV